MNFDLVRPCEHCPFRTGRRKGWLGEERALKIAESLSRDQSFACHNTTEFDYEGEHILRSDEQHCAGAAILLEHLGHPNQMMRIAERLGFYDRTKLDMAASIFENFENFIEHHAEAE